MNPSPTPPSPQTSRRLLLATVIAAVASGNTVLAASGKSKKRTARVPRASGNAQARDIDALVGEIDYLIEVARNLQHKYGGDTSRVRFNYNALIAQLTAARDGSLAYLEAEVMELHSAPPPVIKSRPVMSP